MSSSFSRREVTPITGADFAPLHTLTVPPQSRWPQGNQRKTRLIQEFLRRSCPFARWVRAGIGTALSARLLEQDQAAGETMDERLPAHRTDFTLGEEPGDLTIVKRLVHQPDVVICLLEHAPAAPVTAEQQAAGWRSGRTRSEATSSSAFRPTMKRAWSSESSGCRARLSR